MADKPDLPWLEVWREMNRSRNGEPSALLKQAQGSLVRFSRNPQMRKIRERLQRGVVERVLGTQRPVTTKQKRKSGNKRSVSDADIVKGISILQSKGYMSVDAATAELNQAEINAKRDVVYRWFWKPAYGKSK
jgi:hypothetical protein